VEAVDGSLITWCCRLGREGRPRKHQPYEGAMGGENQAVRSVHPSPSRDAWGLRDVGRGTPERGRLAYRNAQGDHVRPSTGGSDRGTENPTRLSGGSVKLLSERSPFVGKSTLEFPTSAAAGGFLRWPSRSIESPRRRAGPTQLRRGPGKGESRAFSRPTEWSRKCPAWIDADRTDSAPVRDCRRSRLPPSERPG
jgi:hypothetical protein